MLTDKFGRIHDYLRISLTDTCNYRCLYCLPEPEDDAIDVDNGYFPIAGTSASQRMSAAEIDRFARIFVDEGVKRIRLTGGEPLIRKDAKEIIERLAKYPVELCITTNGSYLDKYIETFVESGLRSVNVSLDSLNAETFHRLTGRDELAKVRANIDMLIASGFHLKINVVVMNGYNEHEVVDFIRWTEHVPIHVRFIEFMPFPGNHWRPEKLITYEEIITLAGENFPGIEKLQDGVHETAKKYRINGHKGTFAIISTMSAPFCSGCNRLRLSADGKMRNCLFAKSETDLLSAMRRGGDVRSLIRECVMGKAFMLGGNSAPDWATVRTEAHERSMMGIGG